MSKKTPTGNPQSDTSQQAAAIARWDDEGGASGSSLDPAPGGGLAGQLNNGIRRPSTMEIVMINLTPRHIQAESDRRGIKDGWYATTSRAASLAADFRVGRHAKRISNRSEATSTRIMQGPLRAMEAMIKERKGVDPVCFLTRPRLRYSPDPSVALHFFSSV
jgi:hypothetical protein